LADIWSKEKRSAVMANIRGKNTKPEITLRSYLFRAGFRFRLHDKNLPGKPDIILTKYKTVIFVHGCFWHYHKECREGRIPNTNSKFWSEKLSKNIERDTKNENLLQELGWKVFVVWECDIEKRIEDTVNILTKKMKF
jgi:DNA mismatch endonuclease, patch repair protein